MLRAACKGLSSDWFFLRDDLDSHPPPIRLESELPGLQVCKGCSVTDECLSYALSFKEKPVGIFGATTTIQRRRLVRQGV